MGGSKCFALLGLCVMAALATADKGNYLLGRGMFDMTGPAGEINFMGYGNPAQTGEGIHTRQFSRAFIIVDAATEQRTLFVSIDGCMASHVVTTKALLELEKLYGNLYRAENTIISGTHTHSAPAGFFQYVLYDITSVGIVPQAIDAYVKGIVRSVQIAHENLQPGNILMSSGILLNASINRSPSSYLDNPAEERARYDANTDNLMTLLKLVGADGKPLGMINWFAVHCTSMNHSNRHISSDNKGYASLLFEEEMNEGALPGQGDFVAAFAQTNLGDVSPNTRGPHCMDTGLPCEKNHSTCGGRTELCAASGPGVDMTDSTRIIGERQFVKAKELYKSANIKLEGPIAFRHSYIDMTNQTVEHNGDKVQTCKAAMGYSFAAGTTDGPGAFDFTQGTVKGNPFWTAISALMKSPSAEQKKCQHPKPILVDTGEMFTPFPWQPAVVPIQLVQVGQLLIVSVPGEFTTMAGRRLRQAIKKVVVSHGWGENTTVVIAGLSNLYSSYIVTYEEYQAQRYEAASTLYGEHTLQAYINQFERLATDLATDAKTESLPMPPLDVSTTWDYPFPVLLDTAPGKAHIGDVIQDVKTAYKAGEVVAASFHAGNPRNNLMTNATFLTVEVAVGPNKWKVIRSDGNWDTLFHWEKTNKVDSHSTATIEWRTAPNTPAGLYRLRHFGYYHPFLRHAKPYSGTSSEFHIVAA
ncbi:uncharacterized protein LOC135817810 [Sycon ciliatum]|uniref:uncharacterized protein LOC135817810 n=1 Tax=Sycon ciliatum TaxID=27933 RepID=UPI0031F5F878